MRPINAFEKFSRFLRGHHRGRALDNGVPRPAHGMRRVKRQHLARHQPIKQHPDTGEMLLNGRRFAGGLQLFDIACHMHRPHVLDAHDAPALAPAQERAGRLPVGRTGVLIADVDGEEFEEAPGGPSPARSISAGNLGAFIHHSLPAYFSPTGRTPNSSSTNEPSSIAFIRRS